MSKFKSNQAFKQKLARRIMAIVLSGAMVMSNMSVYAAELAPEKETEIVSEVEETADTGTTADAATEETVADSDGENAETEDSAEESSESEVKEETATDDATEVSSVKETETEDATVKETVAESQAEANTETDSKIEESSAEETESISSEAVDSREDDNAEGEVQTTQYTYVLDASDLYNSEDASMNKTPAFAKGRAGKVSEKGSADYSEAAYFTLNYRDTSSEIKEAGEKEFKGSFSYKGSTSVKENPSNNNYTYTPKHVIAFGGKLQVKSSALVNAISFDVDAGSTVKVWWMAGGAKDSNDIRNVGVYSLNDQNKPVNKDLSKADAAGQNPYYTEFKLEDAGTYYLGGDNTIYIYKVEVETTYNVNEKRTGSWSDAKAPAIGEITSLASTVTVPVTADTTLASGGDKVVVEMYAAEESDGTKRAIGDALATKYSRYIQSDYEMAFEPGKDGLYAFKALLYRDGESNSVASDYTFFNFSSSLSAPQNLKIVENKENYVADTASADVSWSAVDNADKYVMTVAKDGEEAALLTVDIAVSKAEDGTATAAATVAGAADENIKASIADNTITVAMKGKFSRETTYVFDVLAKDSSATYGDSEKASEKFKVPKYDDGSSSNEPATYELDGGTVTPEADKNVSIKAGTDDYFIITTKENDVLKMDSTAREFTIDGTSKTINKGMAWGGSPDVTKKNNDGHLYASVVFTVREGFTANVVVGAYCKSDAAVALYDKEKTTDKGIISGKAYPKETPSVLTFNNIQPGTYYLGNSKAKYYTEDGSTEITGTGNSEIYFVRVTETVSKDVAWANVPNPIIGSAEQGKDADGKLTNEIKVALTNAVINATAGSEKIAVEMYSDEACTTKITSVDADADDDNADSGKATATLNPESSGTYYIKAIGSRSKEDPADVRTSNVYGPVSFKLPLGQPGNLSAKNASTEEKPFVALTWDVVKDAERYIISTWDGSAKLYEEAFVPKPEDLTTDETTGVTTVKYTVDKNIRFGKTYGFRVAAQKGEGESAETGDESTASCRIELVENEDGIEWKSISLTEPFTDADGKEQKGLAKGTVYGDENILKLDVLADMPYKEESTKVEDETYPGFVKGGKNPKPNNGEIPTEGTSFRMDAVTNVKVWFKMKTSTKTFYFIKSEKNAEGVDIVSEIVKTDTGVPGSLKVNLDAGCRYYFYASGSNIEVCDIKYCNDTTRMIPQKIKISEGLKADTTYGDEKYVLINVLEDMPASQIDPGKTISGTTYTASAQGSGNPSPNGGKIPTKGAVFKLKAVDTVKVDFVTASASKTYHLVKTDDAGTILEDKSDSAIPEGTLSFILDAGYTYYFYGDGTKIKVYDISYAKYTEIARVDWDLIANPTIIDIALHKDDKKAENTGRQFDITVEAVVGTKGGDAITVEMYDKDGNVAGSAVSKGEKTRHTISISPKATGEYTFKAILSRDTAVDKEGNEIEYDPKESAETEALAFRLPLDPPAISSVTNLGGGKVEVEWASAKEAEGYRVQAYTDEKCETPFGEPKDSEKAVLNEDGTIKTKAATNAELEGFTVGETYYFKVRSLRIKPEDVTDETPGIYSSVLESAAFEKTITAESQMKWSFAAYGSSSSITSKTWKLDTDKDGNRILDDAGSPKASEVPKNGFEGDYYDGWVNVWSMGGAGKVVPATTDGLAFYYTALDPSVNFRLTATAHVNEWVLSNGQDGFGLMAADQVGENGNGDYLWTNSYQAVVSKIEYNWDGEAVTTDTTKPKISMKIGVGATEKINATKEDIAQITAGDISQPLKWSATQTALDTTYAKYAKSGVTATCNMVDNAGAWDKDKKTWVANVPPSDASELYNDFELTLEKNNTGYFLSYKMPDGKVMTQKYYDPNALNHIVEDKVYVGFFAARNANVTFKNVSLDTTSDYLYAGAEERPIKYITLTKAVGSASVTNTSDYDLIFTSNWDGKLEVRNSENKVVGKADVTGSLDTELAILEDGDNNKDTKAHIILSGLEVGRNEYTLTFTPTRQMKHKPDSTELISYDAVTIPLTVEYRKYGKEGQNLYVSPTGTSTGTGTADDPLDIYTAVKYVQPGQTILLEGGTYSLYKTVSIPSSVRGKPAKEGENEYKNYIRMIAKPGAGRPVFDFNGQARIGMSIDGQYWYFKGFDVTNSQDGSDGIKVSGKHNVLDQVNTYKNGNTGIQISGSGNDTYQYWPSDNLILNCTSFLNADHGYEDADGFAAKLTIGSGNVFDGCIAAYNADDGWDLFAKIESGQIGAVTIKNSVAYKNGYVLVDKDGKLDLEGSEKNAGNGNGFKMGGDGLPGGSIHDADYKVDESGKPVYSGHKLINSVSFMNKSKGFDSNSCPNNKIRDSISFNNEGSNVALYTYSNVKTTGYETSGVISYRTKYKTVVDEISAKNQNAADYANDTTYLWSPKDKTAVNASGGKAAADWFVKTTFKGTNTLYPDKNNVLLGRDEKGKINMDGFLELTDKAAQGGAGLNAPSSPDDFGYNEKNDTDGTVSAGDSAIVDDTVSEELQKELAEVTGTYGFYVKFLEEAEYTGMAVTPEIRVYLNGALFTDYKLSYKNNVNAYVADDARYDGIPDEKRPTLILTLKGSYQGTYEYYFDINPVDINTVSISGLSALANGKAIAVNPTLIYNGKKLSAGKDYVVDDGARNTYTDAKPEGYDVKIDANAGTSLNYKGVANKKFILLADGVDISKAAMKLPATTYDYTGKAIAPVPEGFDANTMEISYINNVEVGKATITVTGRPEKGTVGSKTIPFAIKKTALKAGVNVNVEGISDTVYTGAALSPGKITVSYTGTGADGKDATITVQGVKKGSKDVNTKVKDKDTGLYTYKYGYTYQYKSNTEVGSATLTITGIHNYTGAVNYKFKITAPDIGSVATKAATKDKDGNYVYAFDNDKLEVVYAPEAEYTPNGTTTNVVIKYNGNKVSKKNYSISYKNNKNASDAATAIISWKGSLKGASKIKTEFSFTVTPCDFTSGNITAKSVTDVFTNGKDTINLSELEKSKVALVNVKSPLANKRDYTLVYKYGEDAAEKPLIYDPSDKAQGKTPVTVPEKGLNITVYAKPVGNNYKELPKTAEYENGLEVAEFRVAYYNIAQAKIQIADKKLYEETGTIKPTPIYFVDDTETKQSNLGALNRLNNHTKNANSSAPYYMILTHSKEGELSFGAFANRDAADPKNQYTYDYENTATTAAGKHSVTLYGTGKFGGTKVYKYTLVKKAYNISKVVVDIPEEISMTVISKEYKTDRTITPAAKRQIEAGLTKGFEGRITNINGLNTVLLPEYYECAYDLDFSKWESGSPITVTIKGRNGYSGSKKVKVKVSINVYSDDFTAAAIKAPISATAKADAIKKGITLGKDAFKENISVDGMVLAYDTDFTINDADYIVYATNEKGEYIEADKDAEGKYTEGETRKDENGKVIKDTDGKDKKFKVLRKYSKGYYNNKAASTAEAPAYVCLKGIGEYNGILEVPFTIAEETAEAPAN